MALPTMSLRISPEHHQLLREIGAALRSHPHLAAALRDVLQAQHVGDTDISRAVSPSVLDSILSRLDALEEREPRMSRIEALETRVAALETAAEGKRRPGVKRDRS